MSDETQEEEPDYIDLLSDGEEEYPPEARQPQPDSPEIEVVSSRRVAEPPARHGPESPRPTTLNPPGFIARNMPNFGAVGNLASLLRGRMGGLPPLRSDPAVDTARAGREGAMALGVLGGPLSGLREWQYIPAAERVANLEPDLGYINIDYNMAAFDLMGGSGAATTEPRRRQQHEYNAPPPAEEGFTRKVEEESVVVCPNCRHELGTGEKEEHRQVWVIKQCGHVSHDTDQPIRAC